MPYDSHTGIISVDTTTTPHRGVEIADIQRAVPVTIKRVVDGVTEAKSSSDLGVLCSATVGTRVSDNAGGTTWVVTSRIDINPMAKYKPVRKNKLAALTDAEFSSVRYGMGQNVPQFATSNNNPSVTWTYLKPRGKAPNPPTTDHPEDEPYRVTDFNNYYHYASPPFAFNVSGALDDGMGFDVYINISAANYYSQQGSRLGWDNDKNLTLNDLIHVIAPSYADLGNCYIGFVVHDLTQVGNPLIIIFNTKIDSISTTVPVLYVTANEMYVSAIRYPAVPFLQGRDRFNHNLRVIAAMFQNYGGGSSDAYQVIDPSDPNYIPYTPYSLAFRTGIDRKEIVITHRLTIAGLQFSIDNSGVTMTKTGEVTVGGLVYYQYSVVITSITGYFVIPSNWPFNPGEYIYVYTSIRAVDGTIGGTPTVGTDIEYDTTVELLTTGHQPLVQSTTYTAYFYKDATKSIVISSFASTFHDHGATESKVASPYIVTPT